MPTFHRCQILEADGRVMASDVQVALEESARASGPVWYGTITVTHLTTLASGQTYRLVLDDGACADVRIVDDQILRRDAGRDAIAVLYRPQRFVTRHHGVDAERARRRVGMKLADRAGEQLESALDRRQIGGAGASPAFRGRLLGRQARSVIDRRASSRHSTLSGTTASRLPASRRASFTTKRSPSRAVASQATAST